MNFGFRRNLWGLKPWGVTTALVGVVAAGARLGHLLATASPFEVVPAVSATLTVLMLLAWWFVIKPEWVRRAAEGYAVRLVACCDQLEGASPVGSKAVAPPA